MGDKKSQAPVVVTMEDLILKVRGLEAELAEAREKIDLLEAEIEESKPNAKALRQAHARGLAKGHDNGLEEAAWAVAERIDGSIRGKEMAAEIRALKEGGPR